MKAILLAAGVGNRLKSVSPGPKCLMEFNGESLLSRHLRCLNRHEISEIVIVTGHMHHLIEEEIGKIPQAANVRTEINPDFTNGSVVSLYCACERLEADVPVILMDADVLYHKDVIGRLIESEHQNVFLLDRDFEPGDEPVKLCIRDHRIVEFRKQVNKDLAFDFMGESVGFFRFSEKVFQALHDQTKRYLDGNKASEPYEEVIRDLVLDSPALFGYEDITGLPWLEIDFPDDVIKAERLVAEIDD